MYSLDDPTAGTYGNKDFGYMEEYVFCSVLFYSVLFYCSSFLHSSFLFLSVISLPPYLPPLSLIHLLLHACIL